MSMMTMKILKNDWGMIDTGYKTHKMTLEQLENDSTMP